MGKSLGAEDHGNGFMILGTTKVKKARKELKDYVDDISAYRFWLPVWYEGGPAVWFAVAPGEVWEGARSHTGEPLPR